MDLATFSFKCSHQCGYKAQWSYSIAGRMIKGSIKDCCHETAPNCTPSRSLWSRAVAEKANQAKELTSGFHFIPDRLNEAHREGTGVTFTGWQAGWPHEMHREIERGPLMKQKGLKRGYGGLAAPAWSMPLPYPSVFIMCECVIVHFGVMTQNNTSRSVLQGTWVVLIFRWQWSEPHLDPTISLYRI